MAATITLNLTLNKDNDYASFIDVVPYVGVYIVIIKSELTDGCHAIFHIASSSNGQKQIKKTVCVAGNYSETLSIVWPSESHPILCYSNDQQNPPHGDYHYNLKII